MDGYINFAGFAHEASGRFPLTANDLRDENPDVSWSGQPDDEALAMFGYCRVTAVGPRRTASGETPVADGAGPEGNGRWVTRWRYEAAADLNLT